MHLFCRPAPETAKALALPHHDYVYAGVCLSLYVRVREVR